MGSLGDQLAFNPALGDVGGSGLVSRVLPFPDTFAPRHGSAAAATQLSPTLFLPLCTTSTRSLHSNDHLYLFIAYCIMTQSVSDSTLSPAPFSPFSSYSEVSGVTSDGMCPSHAWPHTVMVGRVAPSLRGEEYIDSVALTLVRACRNQRCSVNFVRP